MFDVYTFNEVRYYEQSGKKQRCILVLRPTLASSGCSPMQRQRQRQSKESSPVYPRAQMSQSLTHRGQQS